MSTTTITSPQEVDQLRKDLASLSKRNERQFHIIEYLLGELKNLGRDIDVLDINPDSNPSNALRSWVNRNHSLEAELEMKNRELLDDLSDCEDEIDFLNADLSKCKAEIRRLHGDQAKVRSEEFFRTLNTGDEDGAK